MKKTILSIAALTLLAGCFSGCSLTNIAQWQKSLANDKAIVIVDVTSIYGHAKFTRIGAITNGMTISPDSTVTISK